MSAGKLKQPLLRRAPFGVGTSAQALFVNLDPLLVALLRECKYLLLLGLDLPPAAQELFQHAETLRRTSSNLQLVCTLYNHAQASLLPVERPLMRQALAKADRLLAQAVAPDASAAAPDPKPTTWKSAGVGQFVAEALAEVQGRGCANARVARILWTSHELSWPRYSFGALARTFPFWRLT